MQLRVKDLRQYLLLRNIPTDTCREKEDLVELVLCHRGTREPPRPVMVVQEEEEEEDEDEEADGDTPEEQEGHDEDDTDSLHSRAASPPSPADSTSEQSLGSASQGVVLSPSDSSGTPSQVTLSYTCFGHFQYLSPHNYVVSRMSCFALTHFFFVR